MEQTAFDWIKTTVQQAPALAVLAYFTWHVLRVTIPGLLAEHKEERAKDWEHFKEILSRVEARWEDAVAALVGKRPPGEGG